jgi:hypothetical protein
MKHTFNTPVTVSGTVNGDMSFGVWTVKDCRWPLWISEALNEYEIDSVRADFTRALHVSYVSKTTLTARHALSEQC